MKGKYDGPVPSITGGYGWSTYDVIGKVWLLAGDIFPQGCQRTAAPSWVKLEAYFVSRRAYSGVPGLWYFCPFTFASSLCSVLVRRDCGLC